jgi:hypothetical protein
MFRPYEIFKKISLTYRVRLICKRMVTGQNSTGQVTELQDNFLYCTLFDDQCTEQTILYCTLFDMSSTGQNNTKFTVMSFLKI